jgi:hypothetical protein
MRSVSKTVARIVLVLRILAFAGAVTQFIFLAYEYGDCFAPSQDPDTGRPRHGAPVDSDDCRLIRSQSESHQRADAAIAMLAVMVVIGAAVWLSKARRQTRRRVLILEVAVVTVGVVYIVLLAAVLR